MTWAPRGMSSTYSARVGRRGGYRVPLEVRTQEPSGCPMIASWVTQPRSEWKVSPLRSRSRWRRPRWSISRACSPSSNLSDFTGLGIRQEQSGHEASQRHGGRDAERRGEAPVIGDPPEPGRADPTRADGEAPDQPRGHAGAPRQVGLAEHDRHREGGDEHEAEQGEQDEHQRPAGYQEEPARERGGEGEHAHHGAADPDAIGPRPRHPRADGARAQDNREQGADQARI